MNGRETSTQPLELPAWRAGLLPDRPLSGLTVLVVEDSRFASEALRLLCLRSGARIRRADTIRAAHRHLKTYRPGVLIVDMGLPDGNGAELIASLANVSPRAPVILGISGDPGYEPIALDAGADGFLQKPIESLAAFQQAILSNLPPEEQPKGLRLLSDELICPDSAALNDDLAHVADILANANDPATIDYVARFLAGIARSVRDGVLEDAANTLGNAQGDIAPHLSRVSGLVHERLGTRHI